MRSLICGLVGLVLLATQGARADDPTKNEPAKLQGTWKVTAAWMRGEQMPADKAAALQLVIEGNRLIIMEKGKPSDERATFKVDATKKPTAIDILPGDKTDKIVPGIYLLNGDELKLCWIKGGKEARPTEFITKPGTKTVLWVLKREKK